MQFSEDGADGVDGAEGVPKTQPLVRGEDAPHWGPRPTTNGKEVG